MSLSRRPQPSVIGGGLGTARPTFCIGKNLQTGPKMMNCLRVHLIVLFFRAKVPAMNPFNSSQQMIFLRLS